MEALIFLIILGALAGLRIYGGIRYTRYLDSLPVAERERLVRQNLRYHL